MSKGERLIKVGFHEGKTLLRLALTYPRLIEVLLEGVQNAIDVNATRIFLSIDMIMRKFYIYDNGSGLSEEQFASTISSVCNSTKTQEMGKYGKYGLGLISPLSVCDEFTFTTTSQKSNYTVYYFNRKNIEIQNKLSIPARNSMNHFDENGKHNSQHGVWWKTRVSGNGFTKDSRLSSVTIEELAKQLQLKFGQSLRERKIDIKIEFRKLGKNSEEETVELKVETPEYLGKELEVFTDKNDESGTTKFKLYTALIGKNGRKGNIMFGFGDGTNPSRLTTHEFISCTNGILVDKDIIDVLKSGILEGDIICEKVTLSPNRREFEENDALVALCVSIEVWYKQVGKDIINKSKEDEQNDEFQEIGRKTMSYAELILKQEKWSAVIKNIKVGTIGTGHIDIAKGKVIGTEERRSITPGGDKTTNPSTNDSGGGGEKKSPPKKEALGHHPGVVYGPKGRKRTEVKGNSTGLRFDYSEFEDTSVPYLYDNDTGTISFNIRHPHWTRCQANRKLPEYHMSVVNIAFTSIIQAGSNPTQVPMIEDLAKNYLDLEVYRILIGDSMIGKR